MGRRSEFQVQIDTLEQDRRPGLKHLVTKLHDERPRWCAMDRGADPVAVAKSMWHSHMASVNLKNQRVFEVETGSFSDIMDELRQQHPSWDDAKLVDHAYDKYSTLVHNAIHAPTLRHKNYELVDVSSIQDGTMPDWLQDIHINWDTPLAIPIIKFLTKGGRALVAECDAAGFECHEGRDWRAHHPDGYLMTQYAHSGALEKIGPKRFQTSQWAGFGGRHFTIKLKTGEKIDLRGPWFGRPPPGWYEIHCVGVDRMARSGTPRAWHSFSGQFGMFVSEVCLVKALQLSKVPLGFARIDGKIEPFMLHHGGPKRFT